MAGVRISQSPGTRVVVPFYVTGAIFFLLLNVLLLFSVDDLRGHHFSPHILALVHTAALGWGTMIIFGAAYQLLPVICEKTLYSEGIALMSWWLLTPGTLLLIYSFWIFDTGLALITGGMLVWFASLLYLVNTAATLKDKKSWTVTKSFLLSSALWFWITVSIGVLLAINLYYPYIPKDHLEILKLHAHAGLAGWFLQMITGVSSRLIPMFLLSKPSGEKWLKLSFYLQNAGLALFLTDGYFFGITARSLFYACLVVAGILLWILFLVDSFRNRVKRKIDFPMKHSIVSFISLIAGFLTILPVYFFSGTQWTMLYGFLLIAGWITGIILGKTFKTLPFIIWNKQYQTLHGKKKIPMPKDLYNEQWVKSQFVFFVSALVLFVSAFLSGQIMIFYTAVFAWTIMTLLYLINVFRIVIHTKRITNAD